MACGRPWMATSVGPMASARARACKSMCSTAARSRSASRPDALRDRTSHVLELGRDAISDVAVEARALGFDCRDRRRRDAEMFAT